MSKAAAHHMPLAIAAVGQWEDYITLPKQHKTLFYWWEPDGSFVDLKPKRITFPEHNGNEWSQGNMQGATQDKPITKWIHSELVGVPRALVQNFQLSQQDINEMLYQRDVSKEDYETTACRWLLSNADKWRSWIPGAVDAPTQPPVDNDQVLAPMKTEGSKRMRAATDGATFTPCNVALFLLTSVGSSWFAIANGL
jgi:hypothetical protein